MPVIWSAISGHGYGHAAQVVPVLNELGRLIPNLKTILRSTVSATFFETASPSRGSSNPFSKTSGAFNTDR